MTTHIFETPPPPPTPRISFGNSSLSKAINVSKAAGTRNPSSITFVIHSIYVLHQYATPILHSYAWQQTLTHMSTDQDSAEWLRFLWYSVKREKMQHTEKHFKLSNLSAILLLQFLSIYFFIFQTAVYQTNNNNRTIDCHTYRRGYINLSSLLTFKAVTSINHHDALSLSLSLSGSKTQTSRTERPNPAMHV